MDILQRYYNDFDDTKLTAKEVAIVDDMVSEIERLKKDLECYGSHSNTCKIIEGGSAYEKCTCGFEQALKEE